MIAVLAVFLPVFYLGVGGPFLVSPVQGGLLDFNKVSRCELGYGILAYNGYGCWCGIGDTGEEPVDEIDRCCMNHDNCYRAVRLNGTCWRITLYIGSFGLYRTKCVNKKAFCVGTNKCAQALCKCDVEAVECWKKYKKPKIRKRCWLH
ncbi:phospholipase A2 [Oesophagostomum dentatum]|uniref:Phospholipase A2 n=1 Tax=Oesophagostomum dentatum TaxID=61180 RepID=A0A0B1TMH2_OESDE|nr:phospholipase A2 [Oesophagostomum dentatum]